MKNKLNQWKYKLIGFMQGRYGNDLLNRHILYFAVFISILSIFTRVPWFNLVAAALIVLVYIRMFSKKRYKRASENKKYVAMIAPIRKRFSRLKKSKTTKYLKCPQCKSEMKVPRGKGEITVTCPSCRTKFDAKS